SGILFPEFGIADIARTSSSYNRRISNVGVFWAINDYMGMRVAGAWESQNYTALEMGLDYNVLRRFLRGGLNVSHYWRDTGQRDLTLRANSSWQPDERTNMTLSASYSSSTDLIRDRSYDPQELNRDIMSNFNLSRRFDWANISIGGSRRHQLRDETETWQAPGLTVNFPTGTLFDASPGASSPFTRPNSSGTRPDGELPDGHAVRCGSGRERSVHQPHLERQRPHRLQPDGHRGEQPATGPEHERDLGGRQPLDQPGRAERNAELQRPHARRVRSHPAGHDRHGAERHVDVRAELGDHAGLPAAPLREDDADTEPEHQRSHGRAERRADVRAGSSQLRRIAWHRSVRLLPGVRPVRAPAPPDLPVVLVLVLARAEVYGRAAGVLLDRRQPARRAEHALDLAEPDVRGEVPAGRRPGPTRSHAGRHHGGR